MLARAHPLLDEGRLRLSRLGRHAFYGSGEIQHWWQGPLLSAIGATLFADSVRTTGRVIDAGALVDVDVGAGVGFASLLVPGRIRIDVAHGLRDGADALTVRYVSPSW